jgi:anthraniloyl-CoA monooxygenase
MMTAMRAADPESAAEIANAFNHWGGIELVFKGSRQRTIGHGLSALAVSSS